MHAGPHGCAYNVERPRGGPPKYINTGSSSLRSPGPFRRGLGLRMLNEYPENRQYLCSSSFPPPGRAAASIGLAYGLSKVSDRLSKKFPGGATAVKMGIPFCAVVAAGTASLLVVRQGELKNGVAVKDTEGKVHGNSKVAAQNGLAQCAATWTFFFSSLFSSFSRFFWFFFYPRLPQFLYSAVPRPSVPLSRTVGRRPPLSGHTRLGADWLLTNACNLTMWQNRGLQARWRGCCGTSRC